MAMTRRKIVAASVSAALSVAVSVGATVWLLGTGRTGGTGGRLPVTAAAAAAPTPAAGGRAPAGAGRQPGNRQPGTGQPGTTAHGADLMPAGLVSAGWLARTAVASRIPVRVLQAYAGAAIVADDEHPACHLGWDTLAAIGDLVSGNGTADGASVGPDGQLRGQILGPVLDGSTTMMRVPDTDHGVLDGDKAFDRAVGPMQLLPSTWAVFGADANGDGKADPNQIDDAALGAARYLCAGSHDLARTADFDAAVHAYNPDDPSFTAQVRQQAAAYARKAAA